MNTNSANHTQTKTDYWLIPHHYLWEGHGLGFMALRDTLIGKVTALAGILTNDDFLLAADGGVLRQGIPHEKANQPKIVRLNSDCAIGFSGASTQAYRLLSLLSGQEAPIGEDMIRWWWENGKSIKKSSRVMVADVDAGIQRALVGWEDGDWTGDPPPCVMLGCMDNGIPHLVTWLADDYYRMMDHLYMGVPIGIPCYPHLRSGEKYVQKREAEDMLFNVEATLEDTAIASIRAVRDCLGGGMISANVMTVRWGDSLEEKWDKSFYY